MEGINAKFPGITIRPANGLADVSALASIFCRTFKNDEWFQWVFAPHIQRADNDERTKRVIERTALSQARMTMKRFSLAPSSHSFLVYDDASGEVAAFAQWSAPETSDARHRHRHLSLWERIVSLTCRIHDWLASILIPLHAGFLLGYGRQHIEVHRRQARWAEHLATADKLYVQASHKDTGYWKLSLLGVLPEFGRRGIASELLQWGIMRADEDDKPIYISASPPGKGAYMKSGFEEVGADLCYPDHPQGGWVETVLVRKSRSERDSSKIP